MEKKYQIFVSSTFKDLIEERVAVTEAIIRKRHIPVGMEYFSASNLSQLEYIKKMLNFVDYYVLIIGGRYGTIEEETGKSFTHLEFEYAVEKGIPIIVFYPENPGGITQDKLDDYPDGKEKLQEFIKIATSNRMSKSYIDSKDLKSEFSLSFDELIDDFPMTGWIRGDKESNVELLMQLNDIRLENEELKNKLNDLMKADTSSEIRLDNEEVVNLNDKIEIIYFVDYPSRLPISGYVKLDYETTINLIIENTGDTLLNGFTSSDFSTNLMKMMNTDAYNYVSKCNDAMTNDGIEYDYKVIVPNKSLMRVLISLELMNIIFKDNYQKYWLTDSGKKIVYDNLAFKRKGK